MINVNVNMMGIFQEHFSKCLSIKVPKDTKIVILRELLICKFFNKSLDGFSYLVKNSVFSDNCNILNDNYVLSDNDTVYLLPPFSGG
jgi:molybdopterin converting factor small subunit